jgi:hypothetical protein
MFLRQRRRQRRSQVSTRGERHLDHEHSEANCRRLDMCVINNMRKDASDRLVNSSRKRLIRRSLETRSSK